MMPGPDDTNTLARLVDLFFHYGPFFLALFVPLVITVMARKWYNDVNVRTNPPASQQERDTYRLYLLGSLGCSGVVIVVALVAWWLMTMSKDYTFRFDVVDLAPNEMVDFPDYYALETQRATAVGSYVHTRSFFIEQATAFSEGDKFYVNYYVLPPATQRTAGLVGLSPTAQFVVEYHQHRGAVSFRVVRSGNQVRLVSEGAGIAVAGARTSKHIAHVPGREFARNDAAIRGAVQ